MSELTKQKILSRITNTAIVITLAISVLSILGWHLGIVILINLGLRSSVIVYNTAICLGLCVIGLAATRFERRSIASLLAWVVVIIASVNLSQYLLQMDLGIDRLFVDPSIAESEAYPGRMAPLTSIAFILAGLAI